MPPKRKAETSAAVRTRCAGGRGLYESRRWPTISISASERSYGRSTAASSKHAKRGKEFREGGERYGGFGKGGRVEEKSRKKKIKSIHDVYLVVLGRNNPSLYTVNGRPLYVHLNGLAIVLLK